MSSEHIIEIRYSDNKPLATLLISTLDFDYECLSKLKLALADLDRDLARGRLNWSYMGSMLAAKLINSWRNVCFLNEHNEERKYLTSRSIVTPIEGAYSDPRTSILKAINVELQGSTSDDKRYNGILDEFTRAYRPDELQYFAEVREFDAFVVTTSKDSAKPIIELLDPDVVAASYGSAPTATLRNVNDLRKNNLALDYFNLTGTIALTHGELDINAKVIDLNLFTEVNGEISHPDLAHTVKRATA